MSRGVRIITNEIDVRLPQFVYDSAAEALIPVIEHDELAGRDGFLAFAELNPDLVACMTGHDTILVSLPITDFGPERQS